MATLFQKLDDVLFCLKDTGGHYLWANDAFLRHAKVAHVGDLTGHTAREIFPAPLVADYEQQDDSLIKQGKETHDRLEMIPNPDGSYGWFLSDKVLIRSHDKRVLAIASMSRALHSPTNTDPRLARLSKVMKCMRKRYAEPLKISQLAEDAGFTTSGLERLFRSIYKLSPKQILTHLRIEAAADLLRHTDTALGTIALECGFCDQAALTRTFRAVTGTTPLRFRKWSHEQADGSQSP